MKRSSKKNAGFGGGVSVESVRCCFVARCVWSRFISCEVDNCIGSHIYFRAACDDRRCSLSLAQAFPPSVREKKMLVIGCGNSELSERMCFDGFKDVDSIDFAESAIAQMKARTPRFDKPGTTCRCERLHKWNRSPSRSYRSYRSSSTVDHT